jgi:DNA polymerase (family 10)
MRGDEHEQQLFASAAEQVRAHRLGSERSLAAFLASQHGTIDPEVLTRLQRIAEQGAWVALESAIADLPADLRLLLDSESITLEQLATIYAQTRATSAAELADAFADGTLGSVPGVGGSVVDAVAAALPRLRGALSRIPLGRATAVAEPVLAFLRSAGDVFWVTPAGSLRRFEETVGDVEIVAMAGRPRETIDELVRLPVAWGVRHRSERRVHLMIDRVQVGVRFPQPHSAGSTLLLLTGSAGHVAALRTLASQAGTRLTFDGLFDRGTRRAGATEEEVYDALGLSFVPPEIRNGEDEVERAARGELPPLVSRSGIRGDLHMHTDYSDGRDSIETMAAACAALGHEYIAITDHSPHSGLSRSLTADDVARQADEIGRVREKYGQMAILHGCEVDILPSGRLDFPDRILEQFDIVLASLHDSAGDSPERLLTRYTDAMRHPLVSIVTHPTNRLVLVRRGYDLDYDRLFEAAVSTNTVLEIDGAPAHLDMDGALARRAIDAGVTVAIDSDCHRADMLERQLEFGIGTARRGWVEARHVLNARSPGELRAHLARKRAG